MGQPTRFAPNGVTNVKKNDILGAMGQLDPTTYATVFKDFHNYLASEWTVTVSTGSVAATAENNGAILITTANVDEDIAQIQMAPATFLPAVGREIFFKARLKIANALLTDLYVGLAVVDTTLIANSVIDITDGIGFFKAATDNFFTVYSRKDTSTGSTSKSNVGTITANTYFTIGFYYNGVNEVSYMFNDVIVGSLPVTTAYLPDTILTPSIGVGQEGVAGAATATVDYIFAAQSR
jgi:hypothetical protein